MKRTLQSYSIPTPFGRRPIIVTEGGSILWMLWNAAVFVARPDYLSTSPAFALLRHVPQPLWAVFALTAAALQLNGLLTGRWHRVALVLAGVYWACFAGGYLAATPLVLGVAPAAWMAFTLLFAAADGQRV